MIISKSIVLLGKNEVLIRFGLDYGIPVIEFTDCCQDISQKVLADIDTELLSSFTISMGNINSATIIRDAAQKAIDYLTARGEQ
ncbi:MAG: hypothetical protein ACREBG_10760 [Pyrinomonadaceae bacterium]